MDDPVYETQMRHKHCEAEIARLRAKVERLTFELKAKSNEVQIADAEIERLQLIIRDAYDELRDIPGVDGARAALAADGK